MDTDDLEPIKKIKPLDFDELSVDELKEYIIEMESEIQKCNEYIDNKQDDKLKAEGLFKK
tara:strand:+ start:443 stop:622 length:180 start_codon:yes stop_codon:yes gene_type:complete